MNALKIWREAYWTQKDFATLLGVAQPVVSAWESGKLRPTILQACEIERFTKGLVKIESWGFDAKIRRILRGEYSLER